MNEPWMRLDPMAFKAEFWPQYDFYDKQVETIYSTEDNRETYVVSANKMG